MWEPVINCANTNKTGPLAAARNLRSNGSSNSRPPHQKRRMKKSRKSNIDEISIRNEIYNDLDIVASVVLYNTDSDEILRAVRQFSEIPLRKHLIIIDNSPRSLGEEFENIDHTSYVFVGGNIGYGSGHNIAIRAARTKCRYHLIMNTDIWFDSNVVSELVSFLDDRPSAGLTMPKVMYPDGSLQHLCRLLPTPFDVLGRRFFPHWTSASNDRYELRSWGYDEVLNVPFLSGCFMLVRSTILEKLGGFDERYFLYAEDLDLSRRIHAISETLFCPSVSIRHTYRKGTHKTLSGTWYAIVNFARYFQKWGWFFDKERRRINERCLGQIEKRDAIYKSHRDPISEN